MSLSGAPSYCFMTWISFSMTGDICGRNKWHTGGSGFRLEAASVVLINRFRCHGNCVVSISTYALFGIWTLKTKLRFYAIAT